MAELLDPPLLNHTSAASGKTHESGSSGLGISRQFNAFAVRQGQTELASTFNDFLARRLEDGELARSYGKWVGTDLAELPATGDEALPIIMAPY